MTSITQYVGVGKWFCDDNTKAKKFFLFLVPQSWHGFSNYPVVKKSERKTWSIYDVKMISKNIKRQSFFNFVLRFCFLSTWTSGVNLTFVKVLFSQEKHLKKYFEVSFLPATSNFVLLKVLLIFYRKLQPTSLGRFKYLK